MERKAQSNGVIVDPLSLNKLVQQVLLEFDLDAARSPFHCQLLLPVDTW